MHGAGTEASERTVGRARVVYAGLLVAVFSFLALILVAPWLRTHEHPLLGQVIYGGLAKSCHQMPERSFWLFGAAMPVCSRCFSLYAGGALGFLLAPLTRGLAAPPPRSHWLGLAALPAVVDFSVGWLGILDNTFWSRGITGVLLGVVAAFYVLPGLIEAFMPRPRVSLGECSWTRTK
jgi:uncharacterized membrane protein